MVSALLTAVDCASHVHLIVGSNPLAGARCSRSLEVGAKPIVIAPEDATVHYSLMKRIEEGEVQWLKRDFRAEDLTTLGRAEVDGVVDTVFVTVGGKQSQGRHSLSLCLLTANICSYTNLQPLSPASHPCERGGRT
jgi:uroporphyrin-III C-methyltransferase